jgi:hypothetical protein
MIYDIGNSREDLLATNRTIRCPLSSSRPPLGGLDLCGLRPFAALMASTGFHPKRQRKLPAARANFLAF